jgi:heme exporter protein A
MGQSGPFQVPAAVRVEEAALVRGGRLLFERLSFAAEPGALVEIRGPNGAGKTSLLRAVCGLLRLNAGQIRVSGAEEASAATHLVGHRDGVKGGIDARAHLSYWAGLFGGAGELIEPALERLGLGEVSDAPARVLSAGQSRRLALGRLLVAPRPVWLLDEPNAGLDQAGKALVEDLIQEHRGRGGLVLTALHESLSLAPDHVINLGAA